FHRVRNFVAKPTKLAYYRKSIRPDRFCPGSQCVRETDVISCPFRPKQINCWEHTGNVFHVHTMNAHHLSETFLVGTLAEAFQERLIGVYCVNQCFELSGQHESLASCATTGVNHDRKTMLR